YGAPDAANTAASAGVGTQYTDLSTGTLYVCTAVTLSPTSTTCTWTQAGGGASPAGPSGAVQCSNVTTFSQCTAANIAALFSGCSGTQYLGADGACHSAAGSGTVTSVSLTVPSWLTFSGSPITTSGTLGITATSAQTQNEFLATPNGVSGAVGLRAIVAADIPTLNQNTTGTAAGLTSYPTLCTGAQMSLGLSSGSNNCSNLPAPSATTLGGIESLVSVSHKWINAISTLGVPSATQPACADLSDASGACSMSTTAGGVLSGTYPNPGFAAGIFQTNGVNNTTSTSQNLI